MGEYKRILQPVYAPRITFYFNPFNEVLLRKYGYQFRIYG